MKYALIDMGSNSIRLTVYHLEGDGFKILFKEKTMAGLAGYVENGALSQDGMDCACQTLRNFQSTLELLQIENLSVFATASLRNISNTAQALEQIRENTGITVEVLSGEQEAEYGFYGATCDVAVTDGLFTDIGGASAELGLFCDGQLMRAGSVPVGSLKLYRDCVKKVMPGKESRHAIEETIQKAFENSDLATLPPREHFICVGGTARAALKLCKKQFGLPDSCRFFTSGQLEDLAKLLCKSDKEAANLILRYEPERIHTLIPGIMVLRYLARQYQAEDFTVSHYGVREGYLLRRVQGKL